MSFPNHTPISSNDYAFIIWTWRLGEYLSSLPLRFGAVSIYELLAQFPCSGYHGLVSSILASICDQLEEIALLACRGGSASEAVLLTREK